MAKFKQTGVGMIEVMAAMFVLSVGLLGVAGLQMQGVRAGHAASLRTVAVVKAIEIIERMQANPNGVNTDGATQYNSNTADTGENNNCEKSGGAMPADCDPADMARHDIWAWKQSLQRTFENMTPTASIAVVPATPSDVVITINWVERGANMTYTTRAQIL